MKLRGLIALPLALTLVVLLHALAGLVVRSAPAERSLVSAARRGDVTVMRLWLLAGASANTWALVDDSAWRREKPLRAAVLGGQAEALRFLLAQGAEVSGGDLSFVSEHGTAEVRDLILTERHARGVCRDSEVGGGNALLAAAEAGHEEVVRLLLSGGCGRSGRHGTWGFKETALRRAIVHNHRGVVVALLEAGANVNHLSESEIALGGITVLQAALNHNNPEIIDLVRQAGAK